MLVTLRYFLKVDSFLDMYIMFYTYAHVIEWNKKLKTCLHVQQDKRNSRPAAGFSLLFTLHVPCNLFGELYLINRCMFLPFRNPSFNADIQIPLKCSYYDMHSKPPPLCGWKSPIRHKTRFNNSISTFIRDSWIIELRHPLPHYHA